MTSVSGTTFTEIPQCGDYYIRKMLRNEEIHPFSIVAESNPIVNHIATFICKSNVVGILTGKLYDIMGTEVKTISDSREIKKGDNPISISVGELTSGVYNYVFEADGNRVNGKVVVSN